jgi:uncharacterized protein (TIGR02246 family)
MKKLLFGAILILSLTSIAFGQGSSANVRKEIEANTKRLTEAFNKGDAAAVAEMYATDAKLLPPNSQIIEGRQNIQAFWQSVISLGAKLQALDTIEVEAHGDTAHELGKYTFMIPQAGGQSVTDQGKYLVVWKKQGGSWKLVRDIWNTSMPAPAQ